MESVALYFKFDFRLPACGNASACEKKSRRGNLYPHAAHANDEHPKVNERSRSLIFRDGGQFPNLFFYSCARPAPGPFAATFETHKAAAVPPVMIVDK